MGILRVPASPRLRVGLALALLLCVQPLSLRAMDEIMLKSGIRVSGTILGQSKDHVIMREGQGNAVYAKKAIWRIYEDITDKPTDTRVMKRDEIPPWWIPLTDLYNEDWVNSLKAIPAGPIAEDGFRNVPYLSFRANTIYEMNIYGHPDDPAGIEIGFYGDIWFHSHDAQKRCRQFIASYLSGLKQLQIMYRLNATGGQESASGLTIAITPRSAKGSYGGWWVTVWNPTKLAAARCRDDATWKTVSAQYLTEVKKFTSGETSWVKYSLKDAAKRYLPVERMEEH